MFAFDRSAAAVLLPLALLLGVVLLHRQADPTAAPPRAQVEREAAAGAKRARTAAKAGDQTVAANLPSR